MPPRRAPAPATRARAAGTGAALFRLCARRSGVCVSTGVACERLLVGRRGLRARSEPPASV